MGHCIDCKYFSLGYSSWGECSCERLHELTDYLQWVDKDFGCILFEKLIIVVPNNTHDLRLHPIK